MPGHVLLRIDPGAVGSLAGNLAGGTHHAFADHGEGFCVLNDVAVAIRCLHGPSAPPASHAASHVIDNVHRGCVRPREGVRRG
jgi:hypothetical protein